MKRIIIGLLCLIGVAYGQNPSNYLYRATRERVISHMVDSMLRIPRYSGTPSGVRVSESSAIDGAIAVDTVNNRLYIFSGNAWVRLANYSEISTPTWQQTLTAGSTLTGNNTITGDGYNFTWDSIGNVKYNLKTGKNFYASSKGSAGYIQLDADNGLGTSNSDFYLAPSESVWSQSLTNGTYNEFGPGLTDNGWLLLSQNPSTGYTTMRMQPGFFDIRATVNLTARQSSIAWYIDSIQYLPGGGKMNIDSLRAAPTADVAYQEPMTWDNRNGRWEHTKTLQARWVPRVGSTTSSATPTINTDNVDIYKLTAQAADITSFTTNLSGTPNDGDILEIQITGTAARAITWGSSFVSTTVTLPTTTTGTTTLTTVLQYYTTSSYGNNKWHCVNYY